MAQPNQQQVVYVQHNQNVQPVMYAQPNQQMQPVMMVPVQQNGQQIQQPVMYVQANQTGQQPVMMVQNNQPVMMVVQPAQQQMVVQPVQQPPPQQTQPVQTVQAQNAPPRPPMTIACFVMCIFSRRAVRDHWRNKSPCFAAWPVVTAIFGIMFTIGAIAMLTAGSVSGGTIVMLVFAIILDILAVLLIYALCWGDANGFRDGVQYPDMQKSTGVMGNCLVM
eukprot:69841_1